MDTIGTDLVDESMKIDSKVEFVVAKEAPSSQEIFDQSLRWHDEFNARFWKDKESYHDRDHVEAADTALQLFVEEAFKENGKDPLDIKGNLKRWNENHPEAFVEEKDFAEVCKLFIGFHDNGNIMEDVKLVDGKWEPVYLEKGYKAEDAEDRSAKIAARVLRNLPEKDPRHKFIPLIQQLINETKFMLTDEKQEFALLSRVADQIGNGLFNKKGTKCVEGLRQEMVHEKPERTYYPSPDFFANFERQRLDQLVPDTNTQTQLLDVLQKPLPEPRAGFSKDPDIRMDSVPMIF